MDSKRGSISFYLIATIVLMVSSLIGVLVLIKKNQDNRNLAQSTCSDSTRQACENFFTDPLNPGRGKCTSIGQKECRWFNGANATYTCQEISSYCTGCSIGTWILTDALSCPGNPVGTLAPDNCGWDGSNWSKIPLGGQCYAVRYHCPDMVSSLQTGGCNPNVAGGKEEGPAYKVYRTSADGTPSFDPSQCGVQQLDSIGECGCKPDYHSIYYPCTSPTLPASTPTPTNTPTPTIPIPTPLPPNCVSLVPAAGVNLNNLQVGKSYSFKLTASGTVTSVEMSAHGASCSDSLRPYAPVLGGAGTYTFTWTPTIAGPFTLYGRVWNDGILECRADCVDQLPRILCANASSCKLTGKSAVTTQVVIAPTSTPTKGLTLTATRTPTPTNTPIPSNTPTGTLAPTNTPSPSTTPGPTNTSVPGPTNTNAPGPTNTPAVIASGPSPTRIILPQSGFEFPLQALTILGAIVTLAGFLVLL